MEKDETLDDRVQRRLRQAVTNILQEIPEILMGMKDGLDGVSQWSDERVFSERFFVQMQPNMQSLFFKRVFPPDSILLVVIPSRK